LTLQAVAPSLGIALRPIDVRDADQLERAVATFARAENGRLIVAPSATISIKRDLIIGLAAWHKLPAVYGARAAVAAGGMAFYGSNERELYRGRPAMSTASSKVERRASSQFSRRISSSL
jgi:putative tryptophan/tyrosine transport system substrate-binding protein